MRSPVRPARLQLADPLLDQGQHPGPDATATQLGVDVAVPDETAARAVCEMRDAREPAVELDEPGVVREVELVPLVTELALGPVGVAVDGDVRRLEHG